MEKAKKKWYKRWWAIILYVFVFLMIIASMGEDQKSTTQETVTLDNPQVNEVNNTIEEQADQPQVAQPTEQPMVKSYQQIFTFSGSGAKKSEPFTITGDRFKIRYDCTGDFCQAFLYNTKSQFDMDLIMNSSEAIKDESIIYGAGEYYIDANTIGSYTMIVEDYK